MFRTVCHRPTLWEALLPPEALVMPAELGAVDRLLDDKRFFEPFRRWFDPAFGRPSIPMETYLRLMFLKSRYRFGVRDPVPGGERLDHLAAVLPDPAGGVGAAPDHVDEADHPVQVDGGGGA